MNIPVLIANILTTLAFFIHTIIGDQEIKMLEPDEKHKNWLNLQEKWTMARCGWHWISYDLLFASVALSLINFSEILPHEPFLLKILATYFAGYGIVWLLTIIISKPFTKNYLKLGQWMLLIVIALLIYWGSLSL